MLNDKILGAEKKMITLSDIKDMTTKLAVKNTSLKKLEEFFE